MTAGDGCLSLIKRYEGFSATAYASGGKWYVGYGTQVAKDAYPNGVTEAEAETLLRNALRSTEAALNAFAAHILRGEPLVADGAEGINGLTISNAAFLSSWLGEEVTLPIDEDLYYEKLQEKIKNSTHKKVVNEKTESDMSSTY